MGAGRARPWDNQKEPHMLKPDGASELRDFTERTFQETVTGVAPGLWHVLGLGHSNAVIIEGGAGDWPGWSGT